MLGWFLSAHHAHSTPPFRERRELRFAKARTPAGSGASPHAPDENEAETHDVEPLDPNTQSKAQAHAEDLQRKTRKKTKDVIDGDDDGDQREAVKERLTAETVLKHLESTHDKLHATYEKLKAGHDVLGKMNDPNATKLWEQGERVLSDSLLNLRFFMDQATVYAQWEKGLLAPIEFYDQLRSVDHPEKNKATEEERLDRDEILRPIWNVIQKSKGKKPSDSLTASGELPDLLDTNAWATYGEATKLSARNAINGMAYLDDKLKFLNEQAEEYGKNFDDSKLTLLVDMREDFLKTQDASGEEAKKTGEGSFFDNLYSINQVLGGMKKWWEAYKHAWTNKDNLKSSQIARKVGKMAEATHLPFTDEADRDLKQQLFSENNKAIKEYQEYLSDHTSPKFMEVFGSNGVLEQNKHDPNRVLAILNYVASKGWLYEIVEGVQKGSKDPYIYGYRLRDLIPPSYMEDRQFEDLYSGFFSKNRKGTEEEAEKWAKRAMIMETEEAFINIFRIQMCGGKNLNFCAARGIFEAAIKKGKDSNMAARMTANLMELVQNNANVRKYMTPHIMNDFGSLVAGQSAFIPTYAIMDKDAQISWMRNKKNRDGRAELTDEAGKLGGVIGRIQKQIKEKAPNYLDKFKNLPDWDRTAAEEKERANIVGRVLATEIVEVAPGKYISIFEPEYASFRSEIPIFKVVGDLNVGKDISDFYNQHSEVLLLPKEQIATVLGIDSNGRFQHVQQAKRLMGWILWQYHELQSKGLKSAAENLRREMKPKLDYTFDQIIKQGKEGPSVSYPAIIGNGETSENAIRLLSKAGFISDEILKKGKPEFRNAIFGGAPPAKKAA